MFAAQLLSKVSHSLWKGNLAAVTILVSTFLQVSSAIWGGWEVGLLTSVNPWIHMAGNSLSIVRNTCQKRHSFPGYISHDASVPFLFLTAEPQASNENNKAINQLFFSPVKQLFCVIHLQTVETAFLAATYHTNMYVFVLGWRNRNTSVESRLILQARVDDITWNIFARSYRIGSVFLMSLEAKVEITRKIIPTLYGSVDDSMHPWLWTSATWQLLHHSTTASMKTEKSLTEYRKTRTAILCLLTSWMSQIPGTKTNKQKLYLPINGSTEELFFFLT